MESLFDVILAGADVQPLLVRGDSPNIYAEVPGATWTPLHLAVLRGLPQVAEALLDAGANPNSKVLSSPGEGPYASLVGMTPTDLAVTLDAADLVALIVRRGGRPGQPGRTNRTLSYELDKARTVSVAESLVVESVLLPLVERAQGQQDWDEADRLLRRILRHEGESDRTQHLRIRGLLARGLTDQALEEASLVFLAYRDQGRYREALQVARCMRFIDSTSGRPYELELEFLAELGWIGEARRCLEQLVSLHAQADNLREIPTCRARFELLCRRPQNRAPSRPPEAWTVPEPMASGSSANLPAVLEEEPPQWWELWWGP